MFYYFFKGPDCKTETVGITIDLTFKDPLKIKDSKEFKELESPLLSAVSYFKHEFYDWDQLFSS